MTGVGYPEIIDIRITNHKTSPCIVHKIVIQVLKCLKISCRLLEFGLGTPSRPTSLASSPSLGPEDQQLLGEIPARGDGNL